MNNKDKNNYQCVSIKHMGYCIAIGMTVLTTKIFLFKRYAM